MSEIYDMQEAARARLWTELAENGQTILTDEGSEYDTRGKEDYRNIVRTALAVIEPAIRADERLAVAHKALTPQNDALAEARHALILAEEQYLAAMQEQITYAENMREDRDEACADLAKATKALSEVVVHLRAREPFYPDDADMADKCEQALTPSPAPYVRPAAAEELAERLELSGRPNLAFDLIVIEAFARIQYDRGRADEMMAQRLANYTAGSYVRPAAEIRAEIKQAKFPMSGDSSDFAEGYRAGLTFALTPPTQEPR